MLDSFHVRVVCAGSLLIFVTCTEWVVFMCTKLFTSTTMLPLQLEGASV